MMARCTHHTCRCARANELALIADRTGEARYLAEATAVHSQEVECREVDPKHKRGKAP
jgi:hypothetical protein